MVTKFRIIILIWISAIPLYPQFSNIEYLTIEEGLSQNTIQCFFQDHQGFLWIGTSDGLNKYDGYKFKVYRHNPNDTTSLSGNRIFCICEDKHGNLWIGTYGGGLNYYVRDKEMFIHYKNKPGDVASLGSNEVTTISGEESGKLWVGTNGGGLNYFDPDKKKFLRYTADSNNPNSISDNRITAIVQDSYGNLWIGTSNGLNKFNRKNKSFTQFFHSAKDIGSLSDSEILSIHEDRTGTLWVGTGSGGLNKYDEAENKFIHFMNTPGDLSSLSANRIYSIYEDRSGNLLIGTIGGGLNKLDRNTGKFTYYRHETGNPTSLSSNSIFSIYKDRSGVLWVGTYNDGINKIDDFEADKFLCYKNIPDNPASLSNNKVYSIFQDRENNIWIGTGNGLNQFNPVNKKFRKYQPAGRDNYSITSGEILAMCEDRSGILWIGIYEEGLIGIDQKTKKIYNYKYEEDNKNSLSSNKIFSILEDHSGNLWIGTESGGLNKFDKSRKTFTRYQYNTADSSSLGSNRVFSIYEDHLNNLWIGTDGGGLNKFDTDNKNFIRYLHHPDDLHSISSNSVLSIYEDHSGYLWIGTYGGGLNRFDIEKKSFDCFNMENGLPNDVIYGILEDNSENIWLSTNRGLSKFNPKAVTFRNYDVKDGLQGNEFNQGAYFKSRDGKLFFGGTEGINIFHPDSIKNNQHIPAIVITNIEIAYKPVHIGFDTLFNRQILQKPISETKSIYLEHTDNIITIEFAALDFHSPIKNKYKYILNGFDNEWHFTDANRRFATYTNLDPGKYTFQVAGTNNDGIWNNKGTKLEILINPPWWSTWWSYILYGIVSLSVFLLTTRFYLNRQRLREELKLEHQHAQKLAEVDKMKSDFFTNISHEFRTPLTLIMGPTDNIISKSADIQVKNQADVIKRNARRLLRLINQLLDLSKLEEKKLKLNVKEGNIVSFIKGIVMTFEEFAERKDINFKIKTSKNEIVMFFDRDKMENIITNLLSNAIKFTDSGGRIEVKVLEKENDMIEIKVKDSGIGIPESELPRLFDRFHQVDSSQTRKYEGSGLGLSLTKELVELHEGSISVKSKERNPVIRSSGWTEFTIEFPRGIYQVSDDKLLNDRKAEENYEYEITGQEYLYGYRETEARPNDDIDNAHTSILIVEDNTDVRNYLREFLTADYTVAEATNGEQGVRIAGSIIPDLIISDLMMPKMDGNELTRILKNDERTSHIPIIILTAKSGQENKIEGLKTGADDYLVKPFSLQELRARVENLISIRKKLQEKFSKSDFLLKPANRKHKSIDEKFLARVLEVIEKHLSEETFSIEECSNEVGMSRTHLHKKLKALVGKTPSQYVRTVRLHKARQFIEERRGTISEAAYSVGFSAPAYFSKCFKDEFGYSPSEVLS